MKRLDIRKAREALADYVTSMDGEPLIITRGGRPIAALVHIDKTDFESLALSTNRDFIELIQRSRARQETEGSISSSEMRRRLGLNQP